MGLRDWLFGKQKAEQPKTKSDSRLEQKQRLSSLSGTQLSEPGRIRTPQPAVTKPVQQSRPAATTDSHQLRCFDRHTNYVDNAVFLPDGKRAVSIGRDYFLRAWEISTVEEAGLISDRDLISTVLVVRPGTDQVLFVSGRYSDSPVVRQ